jgi:ABC-2 type transport system permease protein
VFRVRCGVYLSRNICPARRGGQMFRALRAGGLAAMRLYWEVARLGFQRFATYRGATVAGVFTNTVFGYLRAYVFVAMFASATVIGGYNLSDTLTYTFVSQAMLMPVYLWGWWEVALTIRSGDVVTDFSRPFDYQLYWLAQDLGRATFHAIFRGIPPFLIGALAFHLRLPHHPWTWLFFVLSVYLAVCVSFAARFIVNLSAFWLLDYRGAGTLAAAAWTMFSGQVLPVAFFPAGLLLVTRLLPFIAFIGIPIDIFLEKQQGWALCGVLAVQAGWAVVLLGAGRLLLGRAVHRVVVQGG